MTVGPAIARAATWYGSVEVRIALTSIELMASRMSFSLDRWKTKPMHFWFGGSPYHTQYSILSVSTI